MATVYSAYLLQPRGTRPSGAFGLDFLAFYTAGDFVREGRTAELYDMPRVLAFQHELARRGKVEITGQYAPWWNPPFYAALFVPFSMLAFPIAFKAWTAINLLCAAISCWMLRRLLPAESDWKTWALVPVLLALSTPFMLAITHGQNTCTSLLLLTAVVTLWRAARPPRSPALGRGDQWGVGLVWYGRWAPLLAGIAGGLLLYKPQLGIVLALVMILDLGRPGAAGYAITTAALLLVNLLVLPGTIGEYLHRLPANLHFVQTQSPYLWERHVTFQAFWRLLIQGRASGDTSATVTFLATGSQIVMALLLLRSAIRARALHGRNRDCLIAATIASTPLLMPFYFDYDLLLLAVPAVLTAAQFMRRSISGLNRWIAGTWIVLYAWLMINPDVAEKTRINLAVPLLAILACMLIARVHSIVVTSEIGGESLEPLARAA